MCLWGTSLRPTTRYDGVASSIRMRMLDERRLSGSPGSGEPPTARQRPREHRDETEAGARPNGRLTPQFRHERVGGRRRPKAKSASLPSPQGRKRPGHSGNSAADAEQVSPVAGGAALDAWRFDA
jgi:hypothetical protein